MDRSGRTHQIQVANDPGAFWARIEAEPTSPSVVQSTTTVLPASSTPPAFALAKAVPEGKPLRPSEPSDVSMDLRLPVVASPPVEVSVPYLSLLQEAASYYSLPVELLLALVKVESNFNARAISRKGALGLMQIMPETAADLGVMDAMDPRQNILAGARYLRLMLNEFDGQVSLALAAYNAGPGAVRRAGGIPAIPETQNYVPAVFTAYRTYQATRTKLRETSW